MNDFEVFVSRIGPGKHTTSPYNGIENHGIHYLLDASASQLQHEDFPHIIERRYANALALLKPNPSEPSNEPSYRAPRLPP